MFDIHKIQDRKLPVADLRVILGFFIEFQKALLGDIECMRPLERIRFNTLKIDRLLWTYAVLQKNSQLSDGLKTLPVFCPAPAILSSTLA